MLLAEHFCPSGCDGVEGKILNLSQTLADFFSSFLLFFLRISDLDYDWSKNEGRPFCYFSYGVACSEIEIDCLTGDHKVSRDQADGCSISLLRKGNYVCLMKKCVSSSGLHYVALSSIFFSYIFLL